jgi:hypothetical protein
VGSGRGTSLGGLARGIARIFTLKSFVFRPIMQMELADNGWFQLRVGYRLLLMEHHCE